jgi:RNA polymerase sigma-70 factor, ECF subfamily
MLSLALHLAGGTDTDNESDHADAQLLRAAVRKDPAIFAALVKRHYPVVHRVVWRLANGHVDADDAAQEAFLRFWANPQQVREPAALRGWLVRVASNLVKDRGRRPVQAGMEMAELVSDPSPVASDQLARSEVAARIDLAIARLPDRQRLAITLVQFEQFPNTKAAEIMETSVDAFESLLARARKALKQDLSGEWRDMLSTIEADGS